MSALYRMFQWGKMQKLQKHFSPTLHYISLSSTIRCYPHSSTKSPICTLQVLRPFSLLTTRGAHTWSETAKSFHSGHSTCVTLPLPLGCSQFKSSAFAEAQLRSTHSIISCLQQTGLISFPGVPTFPMGVPITHNSTSN